MTNTPEQQARDMLERIGMEDAQSMSAGDVVELANLIAAKERAMSLLKEWFDQEEREVVDTLEEGSCLFCCVYPYTDHKANCYYLKVRQFLDGLEGAEMADFDKAKQKDCLACLPSFDPDKVKGLKVTEVRALYPRFEGTCKVCGYRGAKYASPSHFICGDW